MKKFFLLLLMALPFLSIGQTARTATSATAKASKLETLLSKTGYTFTKADATVFVTQLEGKHLKEITIIVTEHQEMIIAFAVVKEKAATDLNATQYKQLMKLAMEYDKVKIGLDDEDALMVRIDYTSRLIDEKELSEGLDALGIACDEAFAIVSKK